MACVVNINDTPPWKTPQKDFLWGGTNDIAFLRAAFRQTVEGIHSNTPCMFHYFWRHSATESRKNLKDL